MARLVVGLETFGIFGPVIVSLAFITMGLRWGVSTFVVIVGLGVLLRMALQRLRLLRAGAIDAVTQEYTVTSPIGGSVIVSGLPLEPRRTTVTSSSTSSEPLVPNTWTRQ